ncbi:hypothetical protein DPQ33_15870 [Oceanidesulfovibrio indonesiensis]|uniref:histidine kinase n=1 Tax=Oceanidesulfovibrio indonesiensis TaxID=54767 RepID=A0A7M3MB08_9BACT|nr:PAS domain S-box protein [Oceanidesulfovibrio indonesiensis]TVM15171.1 hypothetical protein DPQ33_15870 [Oceanidesulfovibrio indonesiensis]
MSSTHSGNSNLPPDADHTDGEATLSDCQEHIATLAAQNRSLRDTLEAYELLDTASLELMAIVDRDGIFKFVNKVYERAYGLKREDIIGRHLSDIIQGDVYETVMLPHLERAYQGETVSFQNWFSHPGLGHTFREVICVPMDEYCRLGDVIIYSIDITKRREAEQELRASEEQFRTLVEGMQDGLGVVDTECRLVYVNPRFCEILDRDKDELIGNLFTDFIDAESAERFLMHQEVRRKGISDDYEISLTCADGTERCLRARGQPLYDKDGNFSGSLGLLRDITLRREVEAALRESLRFSRSILDSLVSHVVVLDRDGNITDVNKAWQDFAKENSGSGGSIQVGGNYLEQCRTAVDSENAEDAASAQAALEGIRSVLDGASNFFSMEYPCHAPRQKRWFMMRVSPLQTKAGGAVITHMDVTRERLAKNALQRTRDQLEDRVRERTKDLSSANAELQSAYQELLRANEKLRSEVVQRRKVEKELATSESRYKMLYENAGDGILIFDDAGYVVESNMQLRKLLGREKESLRGVHIGTLVDPEQLSSQPLRMASLLAGEKVLSERNVVTSDGRLIPTEISSKRLADNIILAIVRDVSAKKEVEQALRLSEKRYKSLFEDNVMVMLLIDPESGAIIDANQAACEYYGLPRERLLEISLMDIAIRDPGELLGNLRRAVRNDAHKFLCNHRRADGEIRHVEIFSGPHVLNDRTLVVASVHDVTRRTRAEALAREKEALLQRILSLMKIGIFIIDDEQRRILDFNKVSTKMFSLPSREGVLGQTSQSVLFPMLRDADTHKELRDRDLDVDNARNRELYLTTSDGLSFPVLFNAFPLVQEERQNIILTFLDISERKELERQLTHAQKLESIGQLAAGIAHEINTPTQYVSDNARFIKDAFSDILKLVERLMAFLDSCKESHGENEKTRELDDLAEEVELDFLREEVPKALDQSLEGLDRISSIVMAMKKFSHPGESGMKHTDINDALENTLVVSRNEWKYVAEVETDFDRSMAPALCFPDDLNQVFLNVIVNAAHAIAEKVEGTDQKGTIRIATRDAEKYVEITISDTGSGIPEKHRGRLFDPFFTTKRVGKGTGQGLAISYSVVVDKHGGEIFFDTVEGEGTTFHIRIPKKTTGDS